MKFIYLKILFIILLINSGAEQIWSQNSDAISILKEMIDSIRKLRTIQFTLIQTERFNGLLKNQSDAIKMQISPLKIYISAASTGKSYEVLWIQGQNEGKALVHPGGFPYVTLNLDPEGNTMKEGHHSIFATNLNYIADLVYDAMKKNADNLPGIVSYQGLYDVDGRICDKILLDFHTFRLIPYTVKPDEDLVTIAARHNVNEYMIFEKNKTIKSYTDISPGQTIQIPERYAKSMVIYIDKELKLPIIEMMYDDMGLFERYELKKIKVNPSFSSEVFSKRNTEYHF